MENGINYDSFTKLQKLKLMKDLIGYDEIIESSMRSVIYETLKKIEKSGLPGNHYFVITFLTRYSGVEISQILKNKYPDEMTIAIQYQYRSLEVNQDQFKISLSFGGKYETLKIPYKSITSFADPSMNFALKFTMSYDAIKDESGNNSNEQTKFNTDDISPDSKIISFDAFRNKKDDDK